ncbi:unnamed protein product [Oikopleura dioica]|uniref:Uncharacterized protein n=1 Tax=Oikopleura dioica TaxID=34765 RepID=E4XRC7_OIKDI|nr:unnamed protein product [Oikopleura dioica]
MKALRFLLFAGLVAAQFKSKKEERKLKKKQAKLSLKSAKAVPKKLKKVKNEANVENEANETGSFIDTPHGRAEILQAQTIEDFLGSSAASCWTCNGRNPDECEERGEWRNCHHGQICAVEVRRRSKFFEGINMGCKQAHSCYVSRDENFHDEQEHQQQCKLYENGLSICRQCCVNKKCFVSHGLNLRGDVPIPWQDFTKQMWIANYNIG